MDLCEMIHYFHCHNIDDIVEWMDANVNGIKPKLTLLCSLYCAYYIDTNLWSLYTFYKLIKRIDNERTMKKQKELLRDVYTLLKYKPHKTHSINLDFDIDDIHKLITIQNENTIDDDYKTCCNEHTLSILNVFMYSLLNNNKYNAIITVKYLLSKSDKELFIDPKGKNDVVWILFTIMLSVDRIPLNCKDYIGLAKDIFFYKLSKNSKIRSVRLPILFYSVLVCITKNVKYKTVELPLSNIDDRMSYLYVYTEKNDDDLEMISKIKERKKNEKHYIKPRSLVIDSKDYEKIEKLRKQLHIIRMTNI